MSGHDDLTAGSEQVAVAPAPPPPPPPYPSVPSSPVREAPGRRRVALVAASLVVALSLVVVAVWALAAGDDGGRAGPRSGVVEAPRVETETPPVSLDRVFAPIPGYTMTDAPGEEVADLRSRMDSIPGARGTLDEVGQRYVLRNGRQVALVIALAFDPAHASSPSTATDFYAEVEQTLATNRVLTLSGHRAVAGTTDEGVAIVGVAKGNVHLMAFGWTGSTSTVEDITEKLLVNVPAGHQPVGV